MDTNDITGDNAPADIIHEELHQQLKSSTPILGNVPAVELVAGLGAATYAMAEGASEVLPDDQEIFSDAKISIPEDALGLYDLDVILSSGLDILVEAEAHGACDAISQAYHAQIDCYQEDDGSPFGAVHYVVEAVGDLYDAFHGYKVSSWKAMDQASIRLALAWSDHSYEGGEGRPKPWQPPPVQEDFRSDVELLESSQGRIRSQYCRREDTTEVVPFRRVLVQPMQKVSIPRAFLEDNYDVEAALKVGLHVQVNAEGAVDTDIDKLFLYKYQNPAGWVQYKVNGMTKLYARYRFWEIVKWSRADMTTVCMHLVRPPEDWMPRGKAGSARSAAFNAAFPPGTRGRPAPTPKLEAYTTARWQPGFVLSPDQAYMGGYDVGGSEVQLGGNGASRPEEPLSGSGSDGMGPQDLDEDGGDEMPPDKPFLGTTPSQGFMDVKSKPLLNARVNIMPRRFVEQVMDRDRLVHRGLLVQLALLQEEQRVGSDAADAAQFVVKHVPVTVEHFQHTQGYSQYKLNGLRGACEQYRDCRIDAWVKVDEDTVQLRIVKSKKSQSNWPPSSSDHHAGRKAHAEPTLSRRLSGEGPSLTSLGMPRMPVCIKQGQAVSIPRPFMEQLFCTEQILENGLMVEVQPDGRSPLPQILCGVVCYSNDRGWAQYRIQHDLKHVCAQLAGWNVVTWEQIDEATARLIVSAPSGMECTTGIKRSSPDVLPKLGPVLPGPGSRGSKRQARQHSQHGLGAGLSQASNRTAKGMALISPEKSIHIPSSFFRDNYDVRQVCLDGLNVQIRANGKLQTQTIATSVARYQNNCSFRLLGFKPTCRKYCGWRLDGWECIDGDTVCMNVSGPYDSGLQQDGSGAEDWGEQHGEGASGRAWAATHPAAQRGDCDWEPGPDGSARARWQALGNREEEDDGGYRGSRAKQRDAAGSAHGEGMPPETESQVHRALKDIAAHLCLNVRSFRDMVMREHVRLPAVVQSELISVRFNEGFFETHFPDCKLPKHLLLVINKGGEVLQDRFESRVVKGHVHSNDYLFRLPHPLRQACAGWDMVALTKLLDSTVMLHLVRDSAAALGSRRRGQTRVVGGDTSSGPGGQEQQADHEAAMAIMTLAQAAALSEPGAAREQQAGTPSLPRQLQQVAGLSAAEQLRRAAQQRPESRPGSSQPDGTGQVQMWDQTRELLHSQHGGLAEEQSTAALSSHHHARLQQHQQQQQQQHPQQQQVFVSTGPGGGGYFMSLAQATAAGGCMGFPTMMPGGGGSGGGGGGQVMYVLPQQEEGGGGAALGGQRMAVGGEASNHRPISLDCYLQQQQQQQEQQQLPSRSRDEDDQKYHEDEQRQRKHPHQQHQQSNGGGALPGGMMWGGQQMQVLHGGHVLSMLEGGQLMGMQNMQQQGGGGAGHGNIMRSMQGHGGGGGMQVMQVGPQGQGGQGGVLQMNSRGQLVMQVSGAQGGQQVMMQQGGGGGAMMMQPHMYMMGSHQQVMQSQWAGMPSQGEGGAHASNGGQQPSEQQLHRRS